MDECLVLILLMLHKRNLSCYAVTYLDCVEINKIMSNIKWLKDENSYLFGFSNMYTYFVLLTNYAYIGGVLHISRKLLKDIFIQYGDGYKKSNIIFIDEG